MNTVIRGAAKPSQEYPTALAKDVDPDGVFERAYAEVAGTVVVDEPVRGADLEPSAHVREVSASQSSFAILKGAADAIV